MLKPRGLQVGVMMLAVMVLGLALQRGAAEANDGPPNVILIMTDDQGYGDVAAHGHPHLKTPNMDRLCATGVRLQDFHVDPTCSPTRSALMTGRYSGRVGVWHTVMGRNMLREDETTIADVFQKAGYRTGIFGKWHLGDTYPYGPAYRGFEKVVVHWAGGVGQAPDYWGNDYFEDHYYEDGTWKPFQGYCTDIWFREAMGFIQQNRDEPFFVYLPTNAPHGPFYVAERYSALYDHVEVDQRVRNFWGMITNIDDNLGVLMHRLEDWGLADNTILIFMGDNGTTVSTNWYPDNFNAGMRGMKGSEYEGGHRVHCFIRYPRGGIEGGRDVNRITAHIDLMPTLMELCGVEQPAGLEMDGDSLVPLLTGDADDWPSRTLVVHNQRVLDPIRWKQTSVMTDRWRLVNDKQLYDIRADPGQQDNVIDSHPQVAERLRGEYDRWWEDISQRFDEATPLYIGSEKENPTRLSSHDWLMAGTQNIPWHQNHIRSRVASNGPWALRVLREGRYAFELRERPAVAEYPLKADHARLRVGDHSDQTAAVDSGATKARFEVELPAGDTMLQTWLIEGEQAPRGAYYVDVYYLGE